MFWNKYGMVTPLFKVLGSKVLNFSTSDLLNTQFCICKLAG